MTDDYHDDQTETPTDEPVAATATHHDDQVAAMEGKPTLHDRMAAMEAWVERLVSHTQCPK